MKGLSELARAAKKDAQLNRLKVKGTSGYSKLYASQPAQVKIAAEQGAARQAERAIKNAVSATVEQDEIAAAGVFAAAGNLESK